MDTKHNINDRTDTNRPAPATVPDELKRQLAPNGVLVIPVGVDHQDLIMIVRAGDSSEFHTEVLEPVRFVPLLKGVVC